MCNYNFIHKVMYKVIFTLIKLYISSYIFASSLSAQFVYMVVQNKKVKKTNFFWQQCTKMNKTLCLTVCRN